MFIFYLFIFICGLSAKVTCPILAYKTGLFTEINTIKSEKRKKTRLSSTFLIRVRCQGAVVNRALISFHGGSLKARLTVPF